MSINVRLNYLKSKSFYKKEDVLSVIVRYYHNKKHSTLSTGITVKIKDWNSNFSSSKGNFIKFADKTYEVKNVKISRFLNDLESLITELKSSGIPPSSREIKTRLGFLKEAKKRDYLKEQDVLILMDLFEKSIIENPKLGIGTRKNILNNHRHNKRFIKHYAKDLTYLFTLNDMDEAYQNKYVEYLNDVKLLSVETIKSRFKILRRFASWCRRNRYIEMELPFIVIERKNKERAPNYLKSDEIEGLLNFDEIEYNNPSHSKYTSTYIEDKRTRLKGDKGIITYTNLEVYRDMMLFLCGIGCRYSDLLELKVGNFRFDRNGISVCEFMQLKTGTLVKVPINRLTDNVIRKYTYGKKKEDYVIPRHNRKSGIPNSKFNEHIKKIAKLSGKCNRLVLQVRKNVRGEIVKGTDIPKSLHEIISSHDGRRTFIRMGVSKNIPTHILMKLSGHTTERIFRSYFSTLDEEIKEFGSTMFDTVISQENIGPELVEKIEEVESKSTSSVLKILREDMDAGRITKEEYFNQIKLL